MDDSTVELRGRKKIYTDEKRITVANVISVLRDSLIDHMQNVSEISLLLQYEKGNQPLKRQKVVRKDIDIKVCDNVANEITEFKLGFKWGNPITFVQRGDIDLAKGEPRANDMGVSAVNEMLEAEMAASKDQEMARYIEITGLGYRMIDIKRDYVPGGAVFDYLTLNPLYTFVVYSNDGYKIPMMACTFRTNKNTGNSYYTCFTKDKRFEIKNEYEIINGEPAQERKYSFNGRSGEKNPLGKIPIIEYVRSYDRMGCFERQLSDMDNLNILISDFTNDVAQNTQAIWWGNDVDFKENDKGEVERPKSNDWILTKSNDRGKPSIQPMAVPYDYTGILENIRYRHDRILQKSYVPLQSDPGGGSTGTAMSMSSGWSAAEVEACRGDSITRAGKMAEADLILRCIQKSPHVPPSSPLLTLKVSDMEPRIIRNKTYDMATKANTYATYVSHGIHGRHALQVIDAFPDVEQTWLDSMAGIKEYQKSVVAKGTKEIERKPNGDRIMSDLSDQKENSPITATVN